MSEILLFVYGTLRGGGAASHLLRGCRPLGAASVPGTLYDVEGRYPALVREGEARVHGEFWSCPAGRLAELDRYEGVEEGLFRRVEAEVEGGVCQLYVAGPRLLPALRPDRVIASGRWRIPGSAPAPGEPGPRS